MEALGIDIKLLAAQLINFGLFTFIFMKFIYKPFVAYMSDQKKNEQERERLLQELQAKEEKLAEKEKKVLADARTEAQKLLKEAEKAAAAKKDELMDLARKDAASLKEKAKADMEDEKSKMYDELREKVIRTSEAMTEKVLQDFLNKNTQKDILKEVVSKLKSTKVYEN